MTIMNTSNLKPQCVFDEFLRITEIPRPSKHEEKMSLYLQQWGKDHGLETKADAVGNVLIKKPATPGMENRQTVILQSHMDMVCESNSDVSIDFCNDPIQTEIITDANGDEWLTAKGTTLGADDGIGCAMQLAVLASQDIEHGPIEALFTVDEETGMTGAENLQPDFMSGKLLINLDSEDEGQIFISCAGGCVNDVTFHYKKEEPAAGLFFLELSVKNLVGGHSGDDINKKRANAIKLLSRFLYLEDERYGIHIADIQAGNKHNAIPREGRVIFAVPEAKKHEVKADFNIFLAGVKEEFCCCDPDITMTLNSANEQALIEECVGRNILRALHAVHNGVLANCQQKELDWLVETSSNLASIHTGDTEAKVILSPRSCVMSNLQNIANSISATFQLAGAEVVQTDGYPAWEMKQDSVLRPLAKETYTRLFGKEPDIIGIHAGLECALFAQKYPELDMISTGPTLRGVHSPDEKLLIKTVPMVWDHLIEILRNIPE